MIRGSGRYKVEVGETYGNWVVIELFVKHGVKLFHKCRCNCGTVKCIAPRNLVRGESKSCRCQAGKRTHLMSYSRLYKVWNAVVRRCTIPTSASYHRYGGRGITVCERWMTFEGFFGDMGDPGPGLEIDRIDNDKGYSLENCRWVTRKQNLRNTCRTVRFAVDGIEIPIPYFSDASDFTNAILLSRMKKYGTILAGGGRALTADQIATAKANFLKENPHVQVTN